MKRGDLVTIASGPWRGETAYVLRVHGKTLLLELARLRVHERADNVIPYFRTR